MFVPYSTYKIRVRARNEAGLGLYLNDVINDEFITAERGKELKVSCITPSTVLKEHYRIGMKKKLIEDHRFT